MNGVFTKEGQLGHTHQMKAKATTQGMPKITSAPPEAGTDLSFFSALRRSQPC